MKYFSSGGKNAVPDWISCIIGWYSELTFRYLASFKIKLATAMMMHLFSSKVLSFPSMY